MAKSTATRIRDLGSVPGAEPDDVGPVALPVFIMAALVGFLVVLVLGVWFGIQAVENDFHDQVIGLLRANGQDDIQVEVSGRDVTLSGLVDVEGVDDPDTFVYTRVPTYVTENVLGLDSVEGDQLRYVIVREARDITIPPDPLTITWSDGAASVTGSVSDQATLESIAGKPGAEPVAGVWDDVFSSVDTGGLFVKPGTASERDWLPAIFLLVPEMVELLPEGDIFVNPIGEVVRVTGEFDVRARQIEARETARDILSGVTFNFSSALTYTAPPSELPPPPEQQVIELQTNLDDLIEGKVVEFESDSDIITAAGQALLDEVVVALRQVPNVKVEIGGHTDNVGSDEYNLDLSLRRAEAVLGYLVAQSEPAERFVVVGYGESQPIADNATADGKARNRRIEFIAFTEEITSP